MKSCCFMKCSLRELPVLRVFLPYYTASCWFTYHRNSTEVLNWKNHNLCIWMAIDSSEKITGMIHARLNSPFKFTDVEVVYFMEISWNRNQILLHRCGCFCINIWLDVRFEIPSIFMDCKFGLLWFTNFYSLQRMKHILHICITRSSYRLIIGGSGQKMFCLLGVNHWEFFGALTLENDPIKWIIVEILMEGKYWVNQC